VLCQHSRYTVEHSLKADRANADVAAMLHSIGIRLTISWQCDVVVNPVVRHSGHSAFCRSSIAVSNFYYIDWDKQGCLVRTGGVECVDFRVCKL